MKWSRKVTEQQSNPEPTPDEPTEAPEPAPEAPAEAPEGDDTAEPQTGRRPDFVGESEPESEPESQGDD